MLSLGAIAAAETPANLFKIGAPGTVQIKYDLVLEGRNVKKPEQVNLFLKTLGLKPIGSMMNVASGTGVALTADGKILTNAHVVLLSGQDRLEARLGMLKLFQVQFDRIFSMTAAERKKNNIPQFADSKQLANDLMSLIVDSPIVLNVQVNNRETRAVSVLVADPDRDLALLQSDFVNLSPLKLAGADTLQVGDDVVALGYPLGGTLEELFAQTATTMTKGSVSALRNANLAIQHTANISHGNSGGPLLNTNGEVVGINSAGISEGNNLNLAIPVSVVQKFLQDAKYGEVVAANQDLPAPALPASPAATRNATPGKGMVTVTGLAPGTKVVITAQDGTKIEPAMVPESGVLVLGDLPFGTFNLEADVAVYDKIYYPYFIDTEEAVSIHGYTPGLTLRLDDQKDLVVPANGILVLDNDKKSHTLYVLPGWGRGFRSSVTVADESNYKVVVAAGSLKVAGLPPGVTVTVNGDPRGTTDQQGNWSSIAVPQGPAKVGIKDPAWTVAPQDVLIMHGQSTSLTMNALPAGMVSLVPAQDWKNLRVQLAASDGTTIDAAKLTGTSPQDMQVPVGAYRLLARLVDDSEDTYSRDVAVVSGPTLKFDLPEIVHSAAWNEEQARIAAELARQKAEKAAADQAKLAKVFFVGLEAGEPFGYSLVAGMNLDPFTLRLGGTWWPEPSYAGANLTAGLWFLRKDTFYLGAGVAADYLNVQQDWDYGGAAPAKVVYDRLQVGPQLMAVWYGFCIEAGITWNINRRTIVSPPADGLGFRIMAGWLFNH
jgi:S1-C subfamily serine protease